MKKLAKVLIIAVCSLVLFASSAAADVPATVTTKWKNQRSSTLDLIIDRQGKVSGKFTTAVGCDKGIPKDVVRTTSKNNMAISFIVNFGENCKSITAWNGYFDNSENPT